MNIIDWTSKSKNYTKGRENRAVKFLAIHWIAGGTGQSAAKYLLDNTKNTSAHFVIEDDNVWKLVNTEDTAHAVGDWTSNKESISIEHSATPTRPASEQTYKTSAELINQLCTLYDLPINNKTIVPHNKFSATQCPGTMDIPKLIKLALELDFKPAIEQEKDELEEQVRELNITIKSLKNDVADRKDKITELEDTIKKQNIQIVGLTGDVKVMSELSKMLSAEVKELKVSVTEAVAMANKWEVEHSEIATELTLSNKALQRQITELDNKDIRIVELTVANASFSKKSALQNYTVGDLVGEVLNRLFKR